MSGFGITGFGSDNSSESSLDYVRDAFADITKAADSNAGLTSNSSTNPLSLYFGNDAAPRYGAKVLFVKSIDIVEDRSKWISNRPTYLVTWTENFPSAKAYCYGEASIVKDRNYTYLSLQASTAGCGFGVGGVIRQVKWLMQPPASATADEVIDAVDVGNISSVQSPLANTTAFNTLLPRTNFSPYSSITSLQSYGLHDYRVTLANANEGLKIYGAVVYFENASANIETVSGDVYYDKEKLSAVGSSLAVPSQSSGLGGAVAISVAPTSEFSTTTAAFSDAPSACNGLINTNLINVSSGTGGQFPPGSMVYAQQGATLYVGNVLSVSTDVLTMGVTLPFALSGTTLKLLGQAGTTFSTSSMQADWEYKFSNYGNVYNSVLYNASGTSAALNSFFDSDPALRYRVWGASCWVRNITSDPLNDTFELLVQEGSLLQVDGNYSALELDFRVGSGTAGIGATFILNGLPCFNLCEAPGAGVHRRVVLSNAGPGFNQFRMVGSPSMLATTVSAIRGYRRPLGTSLVSGYPLGGFLQGQTFIQRDSQTASRSAFGQIRRVYADQIPTTSTVGGTLIGSAAGGLRLEMSANTDAGTLNFYGRAFAMVGTKGATFTCLFDGTPQNFSFGQWVGLGSSTAFHTVTFQGENGQTTILEAIDILDPSWHMENVQQFSNPFYQANPESFVVSQGMINLKKGGVGRDILEPRAVVFSNYFGHTFFGSSLGQTALADSSVTIETHGGPVILWVESQPYDALPAQMAIVSSANAPERHFQLRVNRDGTNASSRVIYPAMGDSDAVTGTIWANRLVWPSTLDPNPPPGIHTYSLGAIKAGQSAILTINGRLFARELY